MDLQEFCTAFENLLGQRHNLGTIMEEGQDLLAQLLLCPDCLQEVLTQLILEEDFLHRQWHAPDPNDISVYRSPSKSFSLHLFIWEPGVAYPVHDHGSWGLIGVYANHIREIRFVRHDDGSKPGFADLSPSASTTLGPGSTTQVLPLDQGIHQMRVARPEAGPALTFHAYGQAVRKGYIQIFDPERRVVRRAYPPATLKRILAIKACGSLNRPWAQTALDRLANHTRLDYLKEECLAALAKQKPGT